MGQFLQEVNANMPYTTSVFHFEPKHAHAHKAKDAMIDVSPQLSAWLEMVPPVEIKGDKVHDVNGANFKDVYEKNIELIAELRKQNAQQQKDHEEQLKKHEEETEKQIGAVTKECDQKIFDMTEQHAADKKENDQKLFDMTEQHAADKKESDQKIFDMTEQHAADKKESDQ